MPEVFDTRIEALAEACVDEMGDIFWDFSPRRDASAEYADPRRIALNSVRAAMAELAVAVDTSTIYPASLREEYTTLIGALPESPTDGAVISALVRDAAWTERGARAVLGLAKEYGTSILRNALALADAMDIEDGEAGL